MKKLTAAWLAVAWLMLSVPGIVFAQSMAVTEDRVVDSGTEKFIIGDWKVKSFLGFQMITKEDIEYPEGAKIIGKVVQIAPNLFSTREFSPEYEEYAVHIWSGNYRIVDALSGETFTAQYKVSQDITGIKGSDCVLLIQAESEDGSAAGPLLVDVNHERLLLYLNCGYYELGKNIWSENDMDVSIYDTDVYGDGHYHVNYHNNEAERIPDTESIYLLMVNGGFVPNSNIKMIDGCMLAPVGIISELLGAEVEQDSQNQTILIADRNTTIQLKINSREANVNGTERELGVAPVIINGTAYVPLRFVAEALGADVGYITDLGGQGMGMNWSSTGGRVSVVSIETAEQKPEAYSPEEGLVKVREASADEYQVLLAYFQADSRTLDNNVYKDYDSQDIQFTQQVYGRYYVYRLSAFPNYNIFFNKYTGEVFSEKAGLPFLNVSKGFINISWLYQ